MSHTLLHTFTSHLKASKALHDISFYSVAKSQPSTKPNCTECLHYHHLPHLPAQNLRHLDLNQNGVP